MAGGDRDYIRAVSHPRLFQPSLFFFCIDPFLLAIRCVFKFICDSERDRPIRQEVTGARRMVLAPL